MSNARKTKPSPVTPAPQLLGKGNYSIYQAPNGDGVISYRPEGEDKDSHQVIPKGVWSIIMSALRGEQIDMNPMTLMKMFMGVK